MGGIVLQRARIEHLPLMLTLVSEFCVTDQHTFDPDRVTRALVPLLEDDAHGVVYLADNEQGYVVITWGYSLESGGREALIDEIYLRRRGQGLGSKVMDALFDDMAARGVVKMFLETETHNRRARRFYARQGFVEDDSIWMSRQISAIESANG
ncbi:MAG: GNAT family N-acetyltransferase [Halieaceae bacterium]|jgi:GNAT superfamily N-acetyltransferase